ncbi:hypothetical protein GY45DRAFT_1376179 [Cubamyces sp. BRFM 1775]|nr:hypothetical protein GY45DRAFT_1376463 [Cubamyces sp. BRFM 1775]KAI0323633.1 hypothetical protein GY45DRAFT_1376179 [Cubamyces sp. BRFM 1775]
MLRYVEPPQAFPAHLENFRPAKGRADLGTPWRREDPHALAGSVYRRLDDAGTATAKLSSQPQTQLPSDSSQAALHEEPPKVYPAPRELPTFVVSSKAQNQRENLSRMMDIHITYLLVPPTLADLANSYSQ